MTAFASTAKTVEDLVDVDGPQLILLKTNRNHYMLAVAVMRDGMEEPFFAAEINDKTYDKYFDEKADLHFVFGRAFGRNY